MLITHKTVIAFCLIIPMMNEGAVPDAFIRFSPPQRPYDALYVDYDYECSRMLWSMYEDHQRANVVAIVSNTVVKADDPKDLVAPLRLSYCYLRGLGGLKRDDLAALKWLRVAEMRGSSAALYSLGRLYSRSSWDWPVKQDLVKAFKYFKRSAVAGLPVAMSRLGVCYATGEGTDKDDFAAYSWFSKAAEEGDCLGQYNTVIGLLKGLGTQKDVAKAKALMLKYADARSTMMRSNDSARTFQEWLGDYFSDGIYEPKNIDNAVYWYSRSEGEYSTRRMCELLGLCPDYYAIDIRDCSRMKRLKMTKVYLPKSGKWPDEYKTEYLLLRRIDGGQFVFGSRDDEPGRYPNENRCQLRTVVGPYYLGVFEVTRAQWNHVMGESSDVGDDNPMCPVSNIAFSKICGWQTIKGPRQVYFLNELSEKTGMWFYLPSEEEWEFACRFGSDESTLYGGGDDVECLNGEGVYVGNKGVLSKVGLYKPNALGLYDMLGNVWERVVNLEKAETPAFPWFKIDVAITNFIEGTLSYVPDRHLSVVRGGAWHSSATDCRIGTRYFIDSTKGYDSVGIRVRMRLPTDSDRIYDLAESLEEEP